MTKTVLVSHMALDFSVSKVAIFMVYRDLTPDEIKNKKKEKLFEEGEKCIDQKFKQKNINWNGDPKTVRYRIIPRYDMELIAHNDVGFDDWVVLQKLNPSWYVNAEGTIDPYREKKIVKTSGGLLTIKISIEYVKKIPQYVTFTRSHCNLKEKLTHLGKLFVFQDGLLKDSIDHSLITKNMWKSYNYIREPFLRLDVLSLALYIEDILIKLTTLVSSVWEIVWQLRLRDGNWGYLWVNMNLFTQTTNNTHVIS